MKKNLQTGIIFMSIMCVLVLFFSSCPIGMLNEDGDPITGNVTLDMQGGSGGSTTVTATYEMPMPSGLIAPSRTGYTFDGFYNITGDTKYYTNIMESACLWTDDIKTLQAKWIPYGVGNRGPAGGIIFYDCDADNNSVNSDNLTSDALDWRYLELAPFDINNDGDKPYDHIFGYYRNTDGDLVKVGATETRIGTGQANTTKLITAMGDSAYISGDSNATTTTFYAANLCDSLSITINTEVFDDWFLPSKDELNEIYLKFVEEPYIADLNGTIYWSSSENSDPDPVPDPDPSIPVQPTPASLKAWRQNFNNGTQVDNIGKSNENRVRPVRSFK